jgi:O-antigen ligase
MGAAVALAVAASQAATRTIRLIGVVALQLMLVAGGFTYSRGGLLALGLALVAGIVLTPRRLRTLMWAGAGAAAALPPIVLGLAVHSLSADGVALPRRESAGLLLLIVLVCCSVVLVLGADRLLVLGRSVVVDERDRARIIRALRLAGITLIPVGLLVILLSGAVSHFWHSFTATRGIGDNNPSRLFLADSANRWVWWKEAIGAFSDRPIAGWGGGAFKVVHLLYRHDTLSVNHAHSAPLEWLAETGLIGAALVIAAWSLLLRTGFVAVRRCVPPAERGLAAALLAGALAYTLHAVYDWDWDIPAVTLPALIVLGVLAGAAGRLRPLEPSADPSVTRSAGPGARLFALGAIAAALCLFGVSAALPSLAASRAQAAVVGAAAGPQALAAAQRDAIAAAALDPLSDAGYEASASIALQRGELRIARDYFVRAIDREPWDAAAWSSIAFFDAELHRYREAVGAAHTMLSLDPYNVAYRVEATNIAVQASTGEVPPAGSATGAPTPR